MDARALEMHTQWAPKQDVARKIHSLPTAAPATLAELHQLKSAAQQLENEVRGRAIIAPSESPLVQQSSFSSHVALPPAPIDVMRNRRIRRKAVPTIFAVESEACTVSPAVPQVFTLEVAPLSAPETPRSDASSSKSFQSGPFDLSTGSSSSGSRSDTLLTAAGVVMASVVMDAFQEIAVW